MGDSDGTYVATPVPIPVPTALPQVDEEVLLHELPNGGPRSAEEQRDQTALQNLLLRIERLSQRMEEEDGHMGWQWSYDLSFPYLG